MLLSAVRAPRELAWDFNIERRISAEILPAADHVPILGRTLVGDP
jgi:hypothetical protein